VVEHVAVLAAPVAVRAVVHVDAAEHADVVVRPVAAVVPPPLHLRLVRRQRRSSRSPRPNRTSSPSPKVMSSLSCRPTLAETLVGGLKVN
jgi:hypothetical protein